MSVQEQLGAEQNNRVREAGYGKEDGVRPLADGGHSGQTLPSTEARPVRTGFRLLTRGQDGEQMLYRCSRRVQFVVSHPFHKNTRSRSFDSLCSLRMGGARSMVQLQAVRALEGISDPSLVRRSKAFCLRRLIDGRNLLKIRAMPKWGSVRAEAGQAACRRAQQRGPHFPPVDWRIDGC